MSSLFSCGATPSIHTLLLPGLITGQAVSMKCHKENDSTRGTVIKLI